MGAGGIPRASPVLDNGGGTGMQFEAGVAAGLQCRLFLLCGAAEDKTGGILWPSLAGQESLWSGRVAKKAWK